MINIAGKQDICLVERSKMSESTQRFIEAAELDQLRREGGGKMGERAPYYDDDTPLPEVLRIAANELDEGDWPLLVELLRQAAARIEELEARP